MSDRCYCGLLGQSVLQEDSVDVCGEPRYPVSDPDTLSQIPYTSCCILSFMLVCSLLTFADC